MSDQYILFIFLKFAIQKIVGAVAAPTANIISAVETTIPFSQISTTTPLTFTIQTPIRFQSLHILVEVLTVDTPPFDSVQGIICLPLLPIENTSFKATSDFNSRLVYGGEDAGLCSGQVFVSATKSVSTSFTS
jgi:hypothetical protein